MVSQSGAVGGIRLPPYKKIMIGYDGSKNSERALARATTIAKVTGASLRVVVVVNTSLITLAPMAPAVPSEVFDDLMKNGKEMLANAMSKAGALVPSVTGSLEEGYPARYILEQAAKDGTDLIVLGRRGISGIERFLLGGVSSTIIQHSECDVLIVK